MKKIEFGFNDDKVLNATFSGIEFYNGEYLDTICCNGMDFLVTRIIESYRGLDGNIDVREVAQDHYADGYYVTYANKEKNDLCKKLQDYLNKDKIKKQLSTERALDILRDADFPAFNSHLLKIEPNTEEFAEVVTSIRPEMFKKLKDSKKNGIGISMFHMQEEIQRLKAEIQRLKAEGNNIESGRYR